MNINRHVGFMQVSEKVLHRYYHLARQEIWKRMRSSLRSAPGAASVINHEVSAAFIVKRSLDMLYGRQVESMTAHDNGIDLGLGAVVPFQRGDFFSFFDNATRAELRSGNMSIYTTRRLRNGELKKIHECVVAKYPSFPLPASLSGACKDA